MEGVKPRTIWVLELGYEVSKEKDFGYVEVLLNSPKDPSRQRYGNLM